jgi:hypothetical protein
MRIVRHAAFTAVVLLGLASPNHALRAQDDAPIRKLLKDASPLTMTAITSRCPSFLTLDPAGMGLSGRMQADSNTCTFTRINTLGRADGRRWIVAKYLWRQMGTADSIKRKYFPAETRDTLDVIHFVVFSAPPAGNLWRPEWYDWIQPGITRDLIPTLASRPDGSALLGLLYCVSGTGGCWQEFLHRQDGQWFGVETSFLSTLEDAYEGFGFWKGIYLDAQTLRGVVPAYREGECIACASSLVNFNVLLRGHSLELGRHRLVPVKEPR